MCIRDRSQHTPRTALRALNWFLPLWLKIPRNSSKAVSYTHLIYKGLTIWSPNVNIFRDPRWGRGHETYGEDPYLTSRLGVKFVEGLQGDGEVLKTLTFGLQMVRPL